ncbi:MAG: DUF5711 family protein [Oscillospiraceae bacterium]|nr:DUF5711 family protein [Oscillospiraceae bacterium]
MVKKNNDAAKAVKVKSGGQMPAGKSYSKPPETFGADVPENEYYSAIAGKIKLVKWGVILFLVIFSLGGMILNSNELNFGNAGYLLKDIDIPGQAKAKPEFYIEADEGASICYYKNNIAVLRKNRLDIYNIAGKKSFISRLAYSNPVLVSSEKYMLSYDLGNNKLEIFNAFSKVFEYSGSQPIYGACVTDKGNVAYITSERGYTSVVYVLNGSFEPIFRCFFENDYIVAADIDDKATRLAAAGFYVNQGDYLGKIALYETDSEPRVSTIEVPGERPYGVKVTESGVFAIFDSSLRCYAQKGDELLKYDFKSKKLAAAELGPKLAAIVLSEPTVKTDNRILIFDEGGNILYDNAIALEIIDIKLSKDSKFLYFLARSGLYKVDIEQKTFESVEGEYDETADCIIYANDKNIFMYGLAKINVLSAK